MFSFMGLAMRWYSFLKKISFLFRIFTFDVHQIDTPYLDEQSNGLSYLIDKMKGQDIFAHITLQRGERSELANLANDLL